MSLYVVSDLHLDERSEARLFADERQGRSLAALCGRIARDERAELILLGDCFDFTAMQPPPEGLQEFFDALQVPKQAPPRRTLPQLLEAVRRSNPVGFEALAQLSQRSRLTVVPGNHDHQLGAAEATQALAAAGIRAGIERSPARTVGTRRIALLHGHEFDKGNAKPGGSGEVMTNAMHHAVIPFLRHHGPPPNVRSDPDRLVALRPEEAVVSVLQRWLDEKTFKKFFRAFLRLLAENGYLPRPVSWLANLVSANRVRSAVSSQDRLWERTGLAAIDVLEGRARLPGGAQGPGAPLHGGASRPDALVLGHTHVIDWVVRRGRLYVNLGTWTERAFDASSPRDASLPLLQLDAAGDGMGAVLSDLSRDEAVLQRYQG